MKVAIVGELRASMAVAERLGELGHEVTLFDTSGVSAGLDVDFEPTEGFTVTTDRSALAGADVVFVLDAESSADPARVEDLVQAIGADRSAEGLASLRDGALEARIEMLSRRLIDAEAAAAAARRAHRVLAGRRSVRLALWLARPFTPVFRVVRRLRSRLGAGAGETPGPAVSRTHAEVVDGIVAARPSTYPTSGPMVSIAILTRDGRDHLEVLLPALAESAYQSFEAIVIDNASTDGTAELLAQEWPFPLKVVRNEENVSFSRGNNQAAAAASGELLLFLNNDVEPITEHWLGAMVAAMGSPQKPTAVGALLVYPETGDPVKSFTVQHRGLGLAFRHGEPYAINLGGDDPTDPGLAGIHEAPGVTAAALMVRRQVFEAVGGFHGGFQYGAEDVDLCLRLRSEGPILLQGDAALFHHESATQSREESTALRVRRLVNWQLFAEIWGPRFARSVRRDLVAGSGTWTGRSGPPKAAITLTRDDPASGYGDYYTAHEIGDALVSAGWEVHYAERYQDRWDDLPDDVALVIGLLDAYDARKAPRGAVRIAWVRNWVDRWLDRPWLESYDVVVAGSASAAAAIEAGSRFVPSVMPLATNPDRFHPGPPDSRRHADLVFTGNNWGVPRALLEALEVRAGEEFAIYGRDWNRDRRWKRHWRGPADYGDLPAVYRSAKIVLDDTAGPTIDHGFVNSRVFDALACGTLVVTNNRLGSDEVFDGLVPVYEDAADLRRLLDHYLEDREDRQSRAEALRAVVVDRHTYAHRTAQFLETVDEVLTAPRLAVKICAPDEDTAHHWGDFHFARNLIRALSRRGFLGETHLLPQWHAPDRQDADVVVHIRGLTRYRPKPAALNVLWVISHPDEVTAAEAAEYDVVCVASASLADRLRKALGRDVVFLPQASDGERFGRAEPTDDLREEVLFVGNTRNQRRPIVEWAVEAGLPLAVYGLGWKGRVPDKFIRGEYFPNERLAQLYASAGVVLNDHWPDMAEHGIVSNRVFDVLAAGGVVVSDSVGGLRDLLGEAVPTVGGAGELGEVVRRLLASPDERLTLARRGRDVVLAQHTFEHRARTLVELIAPLLEGRPRDLEGDRFTASDVTRP